MIKKTGLLSLMFCTVAATSAVAETAKPTIAKMCTNCHQAQAGVIRGVFDNIAFKSKTMLIKVDDTMQLLNFEEDDIKVTNGAGKSGDGDLLKANIMQGKSVKVEYTEENGVKSAIKIVEKPAAIISSDVMSPKTVMTTADLEKLVAVGSEKGKYTLIDSRPLHLFQEGAIPTSIDLPYDEFDKLIDRLPKDKNAMIVFYDSGPSCNMSPTSAAKAHKLGYTNIRIYKDGMPGWLGKNFGVLSVKDLKDAWIDKDIPLVLLDVRAASKEFIKGAVAFPAKKAAKSIKGLDIKKNAPIVVYDQKSGKDASKVAAALVKAEFTNVLVLHGGFDGWKQAKHAVAKGKLSVKATYVPKPRLGEVNFDDFKKYAVSLPADVMVIDVRNAADVKKGKLPTAINIPVGDLKKRMSEISKDKLVVTYCNSGAQAEMAYYALKDLGFTNVKFLKAKTTFEQDGSYSIIKD